MIAKSRVVIVNIDGWSKWLMIQADAAHLCCACDHILDIVGMARAVNMSVMPLLCLILNCRVAVVQDSDFLHAEYLDAEKKSIDNIECFCIP